MKNVALLQINFDGHDQDSYRGVMFDVLGEDGMPTAHEEFATGDPARDWRDAIHKALSFGVPVLRSGSCDAFVTCGTGYAWGTDPGKKLILRRLMMAA